jgi:hypothetical protein
LGKIPKSKKSNTEIIIAEHDMSKDLTDAISILELLKTKYAGVLVKKEIRFYRNHNK